MSRRPVARHGVRQSRTVRLALEELEPRRLLAVNVLTYHNDSARTGENLSETTLTPAIVNSNNFGKLFIDAVDGQVYAQPLYLSGVNVPGQGVHNLVFIATEHDSVYAFDADTGGASIWHDSFINPGAGVTTVPATDVNCGQITPEIGITDTPVIDPSTGTLYLCAMTKEVAGSVSYVQRLHALDVATGTEKFGGPVVVQAAVPGTGDGGGTVVFNPKSYKERPGLLLQGGVVYTSWSSHCDIGVYHGWIIGYNAQTLQQVAVYNDTPDGQEGSVWASGAAPAADAGGNIYFMSGNGSFDANSGGRDVGNTITKLSTTGGTLTLADYFAPSNVVQLNNQDLDLGSGGTMLLPDQPGAHPHLLTGAGKEGKIYLVDRDNLGKFNAVADQIVQELPGALSAEFGTPAYFNGTVFYGGAGDPLKAFALSNGVFSPSPASQSAAAFGYPGTTPSISANGTTNGIVWALENAGTAVLHAYEATNLTRELYNSNQAGSRDQPGNAVKFTVPTIANGKVYIGTANGLAVFGILSIKSTDFVNQAYQDLLLRPADNGGLSYWSGLINQGNATRTQVAQSITATGEYRATLVSGLYQTLLHRAADPGGLGVWTSVLAQGGTIEQVKAGLMGSPEYLQTRGGGTNDGFLTAVYQDVLGRSLDAGGRAYFEGQLAQGASRRDVALGVLNSTEARQVLVQSDYAQFLRRNADPGGLQFFVNPLQSGVRDEQVIAALVGSDEYFARL